MCSAAGRPWAAVHSGAHRVPGCPEAAVTLVRRAGLRARLVGADRRLGLVEALERRPALLVLPGGGELATAWTELAPHRDAIRAYVTEGGSYLGLCLGAYLAGRSPGLALFPGDVDQLMRRPGTPLRHTGDAVIEVDWDGQPRRLYAQDPPALLLDPVDASDAPRPEVVARYGNGDVAALVCRAGAGRIALVGPHPEAGEDWFTDAGLAPARPGGEDLGLDLIRRLGLGRI